MDKNFNIIYFIIDKDSRFSFARYLPISNEAILWGLSCKNAGYTQTLPGSEYPPIPTNHPKDYVEKVISGRTLREFQVVYITGGSGWFRSVPHDTQEIKVGDLFILFPGIEHAYSPHKATGWQEYWVGFDGVHAHRLWKRNLFTHHKPVYHIGLDPSLMADFERIIQLCSQQPKGFQIMLGVYIWQLLVHIQVNETNSQTFSYKKDIVMQARQMMELRVEDSIDVKEIASKLQVNYQYLLKLFKKKMGESPYHYYLQLKLARAQELLHYPDLSIKEISAMLNFENQYYFSRFFKKKIGMPPSTWRGRTQLQNKVNEG